MARKMKDSGIEWIGEIPENWELRKGKYVFTERNERGNSKELQLLSPTQKYGVVPQKLYEELSGMKAVKLEENVDYSTLKSIYSGDFCISLRSFQGGFEYSQYNGVVSPAYHVFYKTVPVCDAYFKFLFKDNSFIKKMASLTRTFRDGKSISFEDFSNSYIPVPPFEEQNRIAFFLEERCAYIDSIITKTRSSIDEYKKLKQAVITQAVTKGVRGDRPMKDSGIEWIGEVPTDWRITQLRHCATVKSGITLGKTYEKNVTLYEMPYLRVANVQDGYVSTEDVATLAVTEDEIEKYRLHAGDVLMTEGGDRDKLGRGCVWDGRINPCLHQNHIFAVHTDKTFLLPYFLEYLTASKVGRCYFDVTAIKTTNLACTSSSKVLAFSIPLPGTDEQAEIVAYLKEKCSAIDTLIAKKQAVLSELENYKKSMIYEYVTGKKEVPDGI